MKLAASWIVVSLVILASLAWCAPPAGAGVIEEGLGTLLQSAGDQEFVSAIVYLRDKPDVPALDRDLRNAHATRQVRHQSVVTALRAAADRSQPQILQYLQAGKDAGTVRGFTPHWILNLVVVSATRAEILALAARPEVEAIEANFHATLIESSGSPYIPEPTLGIGVTNSLRAINADRVWHELGITGAGTLVANLDTGVDGNHPALSARWRGNSHPWQECWKDALGTGTQFPVDNYGHGTHVMGTMCGAAPSTGDTVGVAFGALWIADNAIDQGVGSEFDNDVLAAFEWFADPDGNPATVDDVPDVVQNSWGISGAFGGGYLDCDYRWQMAIENCEGAGVVVTFSAGNEGPGTSTLRSPANIAKSPTVNFSVGAVDAESYSWPYPIASWSSRGPSDCDGVSIKPEVSAPGVNIYSTYPGGGYTRMSGTSMAGPHVAGVVGLMRQANPNADVQTIKSVLLNTSRDAGSAGEDNAYGWGVIDAYAAVTAVMAPDTVHPTVTVTAPNGGETLTVGSTFTITWIATDNTGVTQTTLYYSADGGSTWNPIANLGGNPGSYVWTVPNTPSSQALVRVDARDSAGNLGTDRSDAVFTIQAPSGPYLWVQSIDLALVYKGSFINARATVRVRDQNGNPVGGATVQSHWSGLTTDSDVFTTKNNGNGTCDSNKLRNPSGCWTLTIDSVSKAGYTFRNDLGEITDVICTSVAKASGLPAALAVSQTSLSSGTAELRLELPQAGPVRVTIYNAAGQRIRTLVDGNLEAGAHDLAWDGTDEAGHSVRGGVYLVRAEAAGEAVTGKAVLLK